MADDFDPACFALSKHFLLDFPEADNDDALALAIIIQKAVEEWLESEFEPPER